MSGMNPTPGVCCCNRFFIIMVPDLDLDESESLGSAARIGNLPQGGRLQTAMLILPSEAFGR
jgi:hypothetical protein